MFSANLQWHYQAVFAGDLMAACVIKPRLWALLLEVTKARLKHPYILLLPLLGRCVSMLPDLLSCASLLPLVKFHPPL